jgi:hypothetical protein
VRTVHPVIMASHAESNLSTYSLLVQSLVAVACLQGLYWSCREAYHIRLYAIEEYGRVIHEFDRQLWKITRAAKPRHFHDPSSAASPSDMQRQILACFDMLRAAFRSF